MNRLRRLPGRVMVGMSSRLLRSIRRLGGLVGDIDLDTILSSLSPSSFFFSGDRDANQVLTVEHDIWCVFTRVHNYVYDHPNAVSIIYPIYTRLYAYFSCSCQTILPLARLKQT